VIEKTQRRRLTISILAFLFLLALLPKPAAASPADPEKAFRLGTAASPFGFSTAVANLDSDRQPDFAIADRVGDSARGYEYSLEVSLSLGARQVFRFHSLDAALSVSALDLDNDKDLDIVLTQTLTGKVVAVWINDGDGQFSPGKNRDIPPSLDSGRFNGGAKTPSIPAILTFRAPTFLPAESIRSWTPSDATPASIEDEDLLSDKSDLSRSIVPRAPPASLLFNS
jgi:hypothetical protein